MIPIYVALVRNGLRTIDQVPASIRDDVKAGRHRSEHRGVT